MTTNNPSHSTHKAVWDLWRDFTNGTTRSWRMKTPVGVLSFKTKKEAEAARSEYERRKEERENAENKGRAVVPSVADGSLAGGGPGSEEVPYRAAFSRLSDGTAMVVFQSNVSGHKGMPLSLAFAAPDLLEAAKAVQRASAWAYRGDRRAALILMDAAIAKAEGR